MNGFTFADLAPALPEMLLAGGALVLVLLGAIRGERSLGLVNGLAMARLAVALVLVVTGPGDAGTVFNGSFVFDRYGQFLKVLVLVGDSVLYDGVGVVLVLVLMYVVYHTQKKVEAECAGEV